MAVYGYARVSTKTQNIERQIRNILAFDAGADMYQDAFTGRKISRPEFDKLKKKVKAGDTIVFDSVSRMSRSAEDGYALYMEWYNTGVNLVFLKERFIDTATYKEAMKRALNIKGLELESKGLAKMVEGINEYLQELTRDQIKLAFAQAEKEAEDSRQRTVEGLDTARRNGKQVGQIKGAKLTTKKSISAKEIIRKHSVDFGGSLSDAECIKLAGISRNSFYKYKSELRNE